MATYTTTGGETLGEICTGRYGNPSGTVEGVLKANPRLAGQPSRLPAGVVVELPELPAGTTSAAVRLFD